MTKASDAGMTTGDTADKGNRGGIENRQDRRVEGPFEGRRVDLLATPLRIHDLSRSGCLIQWYHEQTPGRRFTLEMEVPDVGWLRVEAEPVYNRADYGFAVKFVDVPPETIAKLDRVIDLLISMNKSTR
jgi:hypothetical protein